MNQAVQFYFQVNLQEKIDKNFLSVKQTMRMPISPIISLDSSFLYLASVTTHVVSYRRANQTL